MVLPNFTYLLLWQTVCFVIPLDWLILMDTQELGSIQGLVWRKRKGKKGKLRAKESKRKTSELRIKRTTDCLWFTMDSYDEEVRNFHLPLSCNF